MYTKEWYNEEFKDMQEFMEPADNTSESLGVYMSFFGPYLCGKHQKTAQFFVDNGLYDWYGSLTDESIKAIIGVE